MIFTIKIQKLQIICKKTSVLAQNLDINLLTYDKIKNVHGFLGHCTILIKDRGTHGFFGTKRSTTKLNGKTVFICHSDA